MKLYCALDIHTLTATHHSCILTSSSIFTFHYSVHLKQCCLGNGRVVSITVHFVQPVKGSRQWESRRVRNVSNDPNLSRTAAIEVRFSLNFAVVFDFTYFRFRPSKAKWIGIVLPNWRNATIRSMFFSLLYTAQCLLTHRVSRRS